MSFKNPPQKAAAGWLVCLLACLALIGMGVLVGSGIWKVGLVFWGRMTGSVLMILTGLGLGYFSTLKFFWMMVTWLSKRDRFSNGKSPKGPKIVAIGGGTGLGAILRGLKEITPHLTAIVTVADDGGSSGRLRKEFGILPPGDIRNCLVAMADIEPLMERLFQYRFTGTSDLSGHNFGNLFLAAMIDITGDFEVALKESSKVLAVRGQVLPATLEHVVLKAELSDGTIMVGESAIPKAKLPIKRVFLDPADCKPVAEAVNAIKEADVIILGPGSLYTSIIPNLLVTDIAGAIRNSGAIKVYICNAMTQAGETDNYTASDHLKAIIKHAGPGLVDIAVVNTETIEADILERYAEEGAKPVRVDLEAITSLGITPLTAKVVAKNRFIRHDAHKIARIISGLYRTERIGHAFGKSLARQLYRFFKGWSGIFFTKLP